MTPKLHIGHDYMHCCGACHDGPPCAMRDRCTRYALHLEAEKLRLEYVCYLVHDSDISQGCTEFWPLDTPNNDYDTKHALNKPKK